MSKNWSSQEAPISTAAPRARAGAGSLPLAGDGGATDVPAEVRDVSGMLPVLPPARGIEGPTERATWNAAERDPHTTAVGSAWMCTWEGGDDRGGKDWY